MRPNRKWILVIALVVSMVTAISGTLAYLTSTDTATNTFTVGNVSIDLEEPNWNPENIPALLPGVKIEKDPQITNTGRTDAWVWMEITLPTDLMTYIDWNKEAWDMSSVTRGATTVVTLKRATTLPAGETSARAFTKVELPATLTSMPASIASKQTVDIVVSAYAIQNEGFDNIDAAIAAYGRNNVPAGAKTAADAAELTAALAEGGEVYLTADIKLPENTTITIKECPPLYGIS